MCIPLVLLELFRTIVNLFILFQNILQLNSMPGRTKKVATRSVGNEPLDKEIYFKHVLRQGHLQLIVLKGLSLAERGRLGIALGHGASDLRKQSKA